MKRAAAAKWCGSTVSAKSKSARTAGGRRRVSDTGDHEFVCGDAEVSAYPRGQMNFVNIGGIAQHYW